MLFETSERIFNKVNTVLVSIIKPSDDSLHDG